MHLKWNNVWDKTLRCLTLPKLSRNMTKINEAVKELLENPAKLKAEENAKKNLFICPYCLKYHISKAYFGAQEHLYSCAENNKGQKNNLLF